MSFGCRLRSRSVPPKQFPLRDDFQNNFPVIQSVTKFPLPFHNDIQSNADGTLKGDASDVEGEASMMMLEKNMQLKMVVAE